MSDSGEIRIATDRERDAVLETLTAILEEAHEHTRDPRIIANALSIALAQVLVSATKRTKLAQTVDLCIAGFRKQVVQALEAQEAADESERGSLQ